MNTKSLENELSAAVEKERSRVAVDEMKKRAIGTAKSYEEFKNLVACADLKPLAPQDISSKSAVSANHGLSALTAAHSKAAGGGRASAFGLGPAPQTAASPAAAAALSAAAPSTAAASVRNDAEFDRAWRRLPKGNSAARFE